MIRFYAFTAMARPGLHVWRPGTPLRLYLHALRGLDLPAGCSAFECELGQTPQEEVYCQLFQWDEAGMAQWDWEQEVHIRRVPRLADRRLPPNVWLFHGSARAVTLDPLAQEQPRVRIHLITAAKYVHGELYAWNAPGVEGAWRPASGHDPHGPYWDIDLRERARSFFQFKFRRPVDRDWRAEADYANRVWVAQDGAEIWTHSEGRDVLSEQPVRRLLTVHFRQEIAPSDPPSMHLWQEGSDFITDCAPEPDVPGWTAHKALLYTGLPYRLKFWNPTLPEQSRWESDEATRDITITGDTEHFALEGDRHLFASRPERSGRVSVTVALQPSGFELASPYQIEAWINRARGRFPLEPGLAFSTYPEVVTSFRVVGAHGTERIERHYLTAGAEGVTEAFVVLGRPPVLAAAPPADQFTDPPFRIRRPGAYEESDHVRFVLYAPTAARVQLWGEWRAGDGLLPMHSTVDGTYWWAQLPVAEIHGGLPPSFAGDFHGARYRYVLDGNPDSHVQDPAAGWVDGSSPDGFSRLVRGNRFAWHDQSWQTPSWDSLRLYQLHPARFSRRAPDVPPLLRVTREVAQPDGYLRQLEVSAIQLMPVNEVGTTNSWGYDPAFFYAVESGYGGPDGLKALVDACHQRGVAVLLDVVFNHAGTTDNSLWPTAREVFFRGDTAWGAMINFGDPQVRFFFEQNIAYFLTEYHIDGFRFDFTRVIVRADRADEPFVRTPGSGGGWEFLQRLRRVARAINPRCLLLAEHLPNEWFMTHPGGPMDSQWCDDFHDEIKKACAGDAAAIPRLAKACKLSHEACDDWYEVTNYAESHDEVGNENGRIANVSGLGRGLRMAKVAAAVTLLSRGIPMLFMGEEAGEYRQFDNTSDAALDLDRYLADDSARRVRDWCNCLLRLRASENIKGPAPLAVTYGQEQQLGLLRGQAGEYFMLANFGEWTGSKSLAELNLPDGLYRERWNSTWPAFAVEGEGEHTNGGPEARLHRGMSMQVPDCGAVILERI